MRRALATLILTGVALVGLGGTAHASTDCELAARRFRTEHRAVWVGAGRPKIVCLDEPYGDFSGRYDDDTRRVLLFPVGVDFDVVVAHEMGHAWFQAHNVAAKVLDYAQIRGLALSGNPNAVIEKISEDYAETFSFALGEWADLGIPAPYSFHNEAGPPTYMQIAALREAGLLPR